MDFWLGGTRCRVYNSYEQEELRMLRIIRLMTGIVAAALCGARKRPSGDAKSDIAFAWPVMTPKFDVALPTVVPTTGMICCPAQPFCPSPGDEVEAWSMYSEAWFPAVVVASSDDPWDTIVVRLKGNASSAHDKLRRDLVRPLRRLAAARRECGHHIDYSAYDRDNIRHIEECTGCRECASHRDDMRRYYAQCRKCGTTKHRELLDGTGGGHEAGGDGLCWFCLPTWPYTRDDAHIARKRACASRV